MWEIINIFMSLDTTCLLYYQRLTPSVPEIPTSWTLCK